MPGRRMLRLAHRGDWRRSPENTLAAFRAAMAIPGCDGVEFDVRLGGEGTPVVIHDDTLARVQRRPGRASELRDAELDAAGVPTLAAVLAALPGDAFLDVELKGDDHGATTAAVLRAGRGDAPGRAVVSSFDPPSLVAMRDALPDWPRWLNADDLSPATLSLALGTGCVAVSAHEDAITVTSVRAAADAGLEVAAWTVRRQSTADRLERLGMIACCVEGEALDARAPGARS
jgi:glycerophosphoryl diester phosphodiesterase